MLKDHETKLAQSTDKLSSERATNAQLEQDVKTFELRKKYISELNLLKMKRPWLVMSSSFLLELERWSNSLDTLIQRLLELAIANPDYVLVM